MSSGTTSCSSIPIFNVLMSPYHSSTLVIFGRLGLFDYIHSKGSVGVCVEELASHADWSIRATSAMMVSLVTSEILTLVELDKDVGHDDVNTKVHHSLAHRYKLTSNAEKFLLSQSPESVVPYFELFWEMSPALLLEKAKSKKEQDNFMLETGAGAPSETFIDAMQGQTSHAAKVLSPLIEDLSSITHFVDVGGGSGVFCLEVCKNVPSSNVRGTIYELEGVCPIAEKYIAKANMSDRVKAVGGNMFHDEVYPAADCYGFGNVLHDWSDETNKSLLQKAYKSLPEDGFGMIMMLEMLVSEDVISTTRATAGLNLVMVTNEDGRQYKGSELMAMLLEVGFCDTKIVTSPETPYSIVVAFKK